MLKGDAYAATEQLRKIDQNKSIIEYYKHYNLFKS